jgi:uncharacterized protein YecT (DUF1311 family)
LLVTYSFGAETDNSVTSCIHLQSTQQQVECFGVETIKWESILNVNYKILNKKLTNAEKQKLKVSQKNWIAFKDKEIEFLNQAFAWNPQTKGTIAKVYRVQYILEVTKARALDLKGYMEAIEDSSKE